MPLIWRLALLLLLLLYIAVPGMALAVALRLRCRRPIDTFLCSFALGLSFSALGVCLLLLANAYTVASAAMLLIVPAVYLVLTRGQLRRRRLTIDEAGHRTATTKSLDFSIVGTNRTQPQEPAMAISVSGRLSGLDWAAAILAGTSLLVWFIESLTTPIGSPVGWDQYITWDKWAADWARRQNIFGYVTGGYPQLQPMFCSLLYKLTASARDPLPAAVFALHALHPVFASVLVITVVRLCILFAIPSWPVLLLVLGHSAMRDAVTSGSADLLLTTLMSVVVVLSAGWVRGEWHTRFGFVPVLGAAAFAAACTKATGFFAVAFVFGMLWISRRQSSAAVSGRNLVLTAGVAIALCLPFYGTQLAQGSTLPEQLSPYEVNFPIHRMLPALADTAASHHGRESAAGWIRASVDQAMTGYEIPRMHSIAAISPFVYLFIVVTLCAAWFVKPCRPILLVAAAYVAVWIRWASYDVRNVLPVLPVGAVCLCAGALSFWRIASKKRTLRVVTCAVLLPLILCTLAAWIVGLGASAGFLRQTEPFGDRLKAMSESPDLAIPFFYPGDAGAYKFLHGSPLATNARHVFTVGRLFRWFENGVYPTSYFSPTFLRPGDVYAGLSQMKPPDPAAYTLVAEIAPYRIWVDQSNGAVLSPSRLALTGVHPPRLLAAEGASAEIEFTGESSLAVYNLDDRAIGPGSILIWRIVAEAVAPDPDIVPVFFVYDPSIVDAARTTVQTDTSRLEEKLIAYSGALTLRQRPSVNVGTDGVLVGVSGNRAGVVLRIREFRVSEYPCNTSECAPL